MVVGKADDDWVSDWKWAASSFNLTPLLPGGPVRIGFRYTGNDGAQIVIDDVQIKPVAAMPFLFLLLE